MRRYNNLTIGFAAILLIILITSATGCSDNGSSNKHNTPPTAVSAGPPSAAAGACPNTMVTVTFSEAMNPSTINATTITLTGPALAAVAGTVSYDVASKTATFSPSASLALNTLYTATVTTGAQDTFANALASNFVWTFTTGNTACLAGPPTVVSAAPPNGTVGVCPNTVAVAAFSEAMNPSTISATTFTLTGPAAAPVTGQVVYDAPDYVATFTPASILALNTTYTATITTGAQDLMGNALAVDATWSFTTATAACQTSQVPLGSAATFEVLAGTTVTNTGPTVITGGNLGLSPGSAVTGFPPGTLTLPAVMQVTDPAAAQGQLDLTTAYIYTAGLPGGASLAGDMSGLTFAPGLYKTSSAVILSAGNVTLDAQGNVNAVFIFQVGSTLTTSGSTQVILAGGAQAKNVFWQVSSEATLGTNSTFQGTIMALKSITLDTGASLNGRALARNAEVALDANPITAP
jgi:ice-binding like protein/Big-like domain-containing protein